jgi:hypothetical protein
MSQEQIIAQCREPSNDGERLIATLPGMQITRHRHKFDFWFGTLRFEVKYAGRPNVIPYGCWGAFSLQFHWNQIDKCEFDWLLLTGRHESRWHLWLLPALEARQRFMTKSMGGQIAYTLNSFRQREKAREFDLHRTSYKKLHEYCAGGTLWMKLPTVIRSKSGLMRKLWEYGLRAELEYSRYHANRRSNSGGGYSGIKGIQRKRGGRNAAKV